MPTTIPITQAAMTYGRHAADEGWGARPPARVPGTGTPGAPAPARRGTWRRVHDLALRLSARIPGGPA